MSTSAAQANATTGLPAASIDFDGALTRLAAAVSALTGLVRQWLYRARYRHELSGLSERQLADMGIDYRSLAQEISKPFWLG